MNLERTERYIKRGLITSCSPAFLCNPWIIGRTTLQSHTAEKLEGSQTELISDQNHWISSGIDRSRIWSGCLCSCVVQRSLQPAACLSLRQKKHQVRICGTAKVLNAHRMSTLKFEVVVCIPVIFYAPLMRHCVCQRVSDCALVC